MFGDNLKALRIREKMTQQELADALQITKRAVSSYELIQREPNFEVIKKIAYYFNASLDYLFDIQLPESSDTVIDKKQNIIERINNMSSENISKVSEYIDFIEHK